MNQKTHKCYEMNEQNIWWKKKLNTFLRNNRQKSYELNEWMNEWMSEGMDEKKNE